MGEIRKLYLSKFIYGFGCMASYTFTLYFLRSGLTQAQIGTLFSIYFIANMILEVPTGGFADTYGHKASFALGLIIESFYYLIFMLHPTFIGFVVGMVVAALGLSFQSGANDSLTYEILNKANKKDDYLKISGRIGAFMSLAVIIAAPIGTMIYKYSPTAPYLISFIFVFLSGLVVYSMKFNYVADFLTADTYVKQIKTGVALALKNRKLLAIFVVGLVSLTSSYVMDGNIIAPLQLKLGIDIGLIGVVQSLIAVGYVVVNYFTYKLVDKIGDVYVLVISLLTSAASLIVLSRINYFYGAGFIIFFFMTHGLRVNVLNNVQQKEATSAQRSTISSAGSVIKSLGTAALLPIWGLSIDKTGISNTLVLLGIFILAIGLAGIWGYKRLKIASV